MVDPDDVPAQVIPDRDSTDHDPIAAADCLCGPSICLTGAGRRHRPTWVGIVIIHHPLTPGKGTDCVLKP